MMIKRFRENGVIRGGSAIIVILLIMAGPGLAKEQFRGRLLTQRAPVEPPAVDILIEVDSWSTPEEILQMAETLSKSGDEAFLNLFNSTKKGVVRFLYARGYNLTIHMAQMREEADGKKKVILVFRKEPWSQGTQLGVGRFYFMVIELTLNEKGKGEGRFYEDAQIQFDLVNGRVFLQEYGISPKIIASVQEVKKK
ncbi:MAG: hypothetical protein WBI18_11030 [Candidatus Saccharicenans sp.]